MRRWTGVGLTLVAAVVMACSDSTDGVGQGVLEVRLTDAPLSADSVQAVNIFVTRVEVRVDTADEAAAAALEDSEGDDDGGGWATVAEPNAVFNLVDLQDGTTALLGTSPIDAGQYRALRLVIDETQSSIVLKNGTELTGDASPFVKFPSGAQSGLKVQLTEPLEVVAGAVVVTVIDFDLSRSFVLRGTEMRNGIIFRPVLRTVASGG